MLKRNSLFLIILTISFLINFASTSDSEQCSDNNSEFLNVYEEFRGNPCVIENTSENGFCTHRRQCPLVDRDYKNFNKGNYTSCGFKCCKEIICCPNPIIENKRISEKSKFSFVLFNRFINGILINFQNVWNTAKKPFLKHLLM